MSSRTVLARRVVLATLLVGVLDLCLAAGVWIAWLDRTTFERILQSIAAGVLGRDAFAQGATSAALGTVLHFLIAGLWSSAYAGVYASSPRLRTAVGSPLGRVLVGAAVGLLVWAAMAFVVVPLSRARPQPLSVIALVMAVGHMVVVGQPIAWLVRTRR